MIASWRRSDYRFLPYCRTLRSGQFISEGSRMIVRLGVRALFPQKMVDIFATGGFCICRCGGRRNNIDILLDIGIEGGGAWSVY